MERVIQESGRITLFTAQAMNLLFRRPLRFRHIIDQATRIGLLSLPVAGLTAMFTGMVMVIQIGVELQRFGAITYSAGITIRALTRELIPVFTAIVVGARIAAAMAAELGTMRVTEQLDAMATMGVRPIKYLVVPRVVTATIMVPVVTVYAGIIGFLGGWLMGILVLHIPASLFLSTTMSWLEIPDVISGLSKTFVFGFLIGIGGCYHGFNARGGAEGVGRATTSAVVFVILAVLVSDFLLTTWFIYFEGGIN